MAQIKEIVADLLKDGATKHEFVIETVTPEKKTASTQLLCSIDSEIDYIDKNGDDAKTTIFFTSNVDLSIAAAKIPALAPFAGILKNDASGNFAMLLLGGAKVTIYQERLEAGVEYTDRYTNRPYVPQQDQIYAYIADIVLADGNTLLADARKAMLAKALDFGF